MKTQNKNDVVDVKVTSEDVKTNPDTTKVEKKKRKDMSYSEKLLDTFEKKSNVLTKSEVSHIENLTSKYKELASSAIRSQLEMSKFIASLHKKRIDDMISENAYNAFLVRIRLDSKSSTYRKHIAIAKQSAKLEQYLDYLPEHYSVLYEICTLSSDEFERFEREILAKKIICKMTDVKRFKTKTQNLQLAQAKIEMNKDEMIVLDVTFKRDDFKKNQEKILELIAELRYYHAEVDANTDIQSAETLQKKVA